MTKREVKNIQEKIQSIRYGTTIYIKKRELRLITKILEALSYRMPVPVTEYIRYVDSLSAYGKPVYYTYGLCPTCGSVLDRSYWSYCPSCGQRLK